MDRIELKNIKVYAYHGCFDFEKRKGQPFFLSLYIYTDLKKAGTSDDLKDTINYAEISELAVSTFKETTFNTIEAAAENVLESIMLKFPIIKRLTVRVSKPQAPVDVDAEDIAVEITRQRHRVYLGLGSNLGDREGYLKMAVERSDGVLTDDIALLLLQGQS